MDSTKNSIYFRLKISGADVLEESKINCFRLLACVIRSDFFTKLSNVYSESIYEMT